MNTNSLHLLKTAFDFHQKGLLNEAIAIYNKVLLRNKRDFDALNLNGIAHLQKGDFKAAAELLSSAVEISPENIDVRLHLGAAYAQLGKTEIAEKTFKDVLETAPQNAEAHYNLGILNVSKREFQVAKYFFKAATSLKGNYVEAIINLGNVCYETKEYENALCAFEQANKLAPNVPTIMLGLAGALHKVGKELESNIVSEDLITKHPNLPEGHDNFGQILLAQGKFDEALRQFQKAISLNSNLASAFRNASKTLTAMGDSTNALEFIKKSCEIENSSSENFIILGSAYKALNQNNLAEAAFKKSVELNKNSADAHCALGDYYFSVDLSAQAESEYKLVLEIDSKFDRIYGRLIETQLRSCKWTGLDPLIASAIKVSSEGTRAVSPLISLALCDNPKTLRQIAELSAAHLQKIFGIGSYTQSPKKRQRIRIGYFSPDFCEHPILYLAAGIFENHNKSEFEIFAYSLNDKIFSKSALRERVKSAVDSFFEIESMTLEKQIKLARSHNLDIAIDLSGHTKNSRLSILTHRVAPNQITYLGFPGTTGTPNMDYIIGDSIVTPVGCEAAYSERIIRLPNCFQANDSRRFIDRSEPPPYDISETPPPFVFACFNQAYKISSEIFNAWLRILISTPNSILWLYADNNSQIENLKNTARLAGVSTSRIYFANKVPYSAHLGRYQWVNLVLDTFPFTGGTTTSDALWGGAPVLSLIGKSFASRMAASIISSVGTPELVTTSIENYESIAIKLYSNPNELAAIRKLIADAKERSTLFNTSLFTKNLESAFKTIYYSLR